MPKTLRQFISVALVAALSSVLGIALPVRDIGWAQTTTPDTTKVPTKASTKASTKLPTKLPSKTKFQMGLSAKKAPDSVKAKSRSPAKWGMPGNKPKGNKTSPAAKSQNIPKQPTITKLAIPAIPETPELESIKPKATAKLKAAAKATAVVAPESPSAQGMTDILLVSGLIAIFVLVGLVAVRRRKKQKDAASAEASAIINGSQTGSGSGTANNLGMTG